MEEVIMIEDLAKEYFKANDSDKFVINKGLLSVKLDLGGTKTEAICKGLEVEYPFIKNDRGFITIDRKGFEEFEVLMEEQRKHISTIYEIRAKYPQLTKSIENYKAELESKTKILADKEREKQDLENKAKEMEEMIAQFDNTIRENQAKIDGLTTEYDRLKAEAEVKDREYNEELNKQKNDLEEQIAHMKAEIIKKEAEIKPLKDEANNLANRLTITISELENYKKHNSWLQRYFKRDKLKQAEALLMEITHSLKSADDSEFFIYGT